MANIDVYLQEIMDARYGKDVRKAIHDAIKAMNDELTTGEVVSFNGRKGHVVSETGDYSISQISSTGGVEGQVPVVNNSGGFVMGTVATSLNGLSDVNISSPSNSQVLRYDSSENKWVNGPVPGGGGSSPIVELIKFTANQNETWKELLHRVAVELKDLFSQMSDFTIIHFNRSQTSTGYIDYSRDNKILYYQGMENSNYQFKFISLHGDGEESHSMTLDALYLNNNYYGRGNISTGEIDDLSNEVVNYSSNVVTLTVKTISV